jgi:pimeloyl-ACP methyl ester carboxylesterase
MIGVRTEIMGLYVMGKNFSEEYVQINGISQYFLHYPSPQREVVIMLHGGPGSSNAFFAHHLRPYWDFSNVVYYDQRGTGKTLKKNKTKANDLTMDVFISDLRQTISYIKEKYQTERIILLGQSWGTILGTHYILRHPDDVVGYIGTGQAAHARREMKIAYDKLKNTLESAGAKKDLEKQKKLGDYPNVSADDFYNKVIPFQRLQSKHGLAINVLKVLKAAIKSPVFRLNDLYFLPKGSKLTHQSADILNLLLNYDIWDTTEYPVPVYYVLGRDDWQVPSVLAAEYFEKIKAPQKGLYWVENAGHAADIDNPADFCKTVREIIMQL